MEKCRLCLIKTEPGFSVNIFQTPVGYNDDVISNVIMTLAPIEVFLQILHLIDSSFLFLRYLQRMIFLNWLVMIAFRR